MTPRACVQRLRSARRPRALGLIEVLLSLAITATLLTALATAVYACVRSYRVNQEQGILMNRARLVLTNIMNQARMTQYHQPLASDTATMTAFQACNGTGQTVTGHGIQILQIAEYLYSDATTRATTQQAPQSYTYAYDSTAQQLTLQIGSSPARVILDGVDRFDVTFTPMRSADQIAAGNTACDAVASISVTLTIHSTSRTFTTPERNAQNPSSVTLSASVVPRRNAYAGSTTSDTILHYRGL